MFSRLNAMVCRQVLEMNIETQKYIVRPSEKLSLSERNSLDGTEFDKKELKEELRSTVARIAKKQEALYAEGKHSVLLVIQAMDAGGKDSTIEAITRGVNPQGCVVQSFKAPSKEELSHDFLWRVHNTAPRKGYIRIFNRSHYEDVLIVRVHGWASPEMTERRYGHIKDFERLLSDHGTKVVKVMLHISREYQLEQFKERLREPEKNWKFNPGDLEERKLWDKYMESFEIALSKCSTDNCPWYVVPSENKWHRCLIVARILEEALDSIDPQYPDPDFDPTEYTPENIS